MTTNPSSNATGKPSRVAAPLWIRVLLKTTVAGMLLMLIVGLGIAIWFAMSFADADADVEAEMELIQQSGEPASLEALNDYYRLPDNADDVTAQWREAFAVLASDEYLDDAEAIPIVGNLPDEIPPPDEPWDERAAVETFLDKYQDAIGKLHEAADRDGAARYADPPASPLDDVQIVHDLHAASRLLHLAAERAAREGDGAGAVRSIRTMTKYSYREGVPKRSVMRPR